MHNGFSKWGSRYLLDDHALKGKMKGKRAFSITDDVRVIYVESDNVFVFLDIGSHNQVYK
jgi:addiction module RelE/StbE family toxin